MSHYLRLAAAHRDVAVALERLDANPGNAILATDVDDAVRRLERVRAMLHTPWGVAA